MTERKPRNRGGRPQKLEQRPHFATALEYAMHVINDNTVIASRRDTMAMTVLRSGQQAPTTEPSGKKAERKAAASKAAEKFDIPAPPPRQTVQ